MVVLREDAFFHGDFVRLEERDYEGDEGGVLVLEEADFADDPAMHLFGHLQSGTKVTSDLICGGNSAKIFCLSTQENIPFCVVYSMFSRSSSRSFFDIFASLQNSLSWAILSVILED